MSFAIRCLLVVGFAASIGASSAPAQLRVATWNVTSYSTQIPSNRDPSIQTAVYDVFQGRSLAPDVLVFQEVLSQAAANNLRTILNNAVNSPGDWELAQFVNGNDTDSALLYRTSKVTVTNVTVVAAGGPPPNHPRNIMRYTVRLNGYAPGAHGADLYIYSSHMKAQDDGSGVDEQQRLLEAQRIRLNAASLPAAAQFMLVGDFNIRSSSAPEYVELVGSQANNAGRLFDPISTPGSWNNNCNFRIVHTQDPVGAGGMDDRFDQILVKQTLIDGLGFDYIGNAAIPYSTTTWNDGNHSYRAWGNDGTSCNGQLTVEGNTMVGPVIAQALKTSASNGGHLPVFVDLRVPAKISAPTLIDFGTVALGAVAQEPVVITNAGDTALWNVTGVASLRYELLPAGDVTGPAGAGFIEPPTPGGNTHVYTLDTSTPGAKAGTLTILNDSVESPVFVVNFIGQVTGGVPGDVDGDGDVDQADLAALLATYNLCLGDPGYNPAADFDGDNCVGQSDLALLLANYAQ